VPLSDIYLILYVIYSMHIPTDRHHSCKVDNVKRLVVHTSLLLNGLCDGIERKHVILFYLIVL